MIFYRACLTVVFTICAGSYALAQNSGAIAAELPTSAELARKATDALREKDYDQAILFLRQAISLNPNDAGANYDPTAFHKAGISEHGRSQVFQMVADRRLMSRYLDRSGDLWNWTTWRFSTKVNGSEINWDPSPTDDPRCSSQMRPAEADKPATIRIRDVPGQAAIKKGDAFDWLWQCAIYELHNLDNSQDFLELYRQAREDKIDKREFVMKMFALEVKAEQRTRKWYVEVYIPYAKRQGLQTRPDWWYCAEWGSTEALFSKCIDKNKYPWVPYSSFYEGLQRSGQPGQKPALTDDRGS